MTRSPVFFVLVCLSLLALPALARDSSSQVVVKNYSDWVIEEFYMSPVEEDDWGDDLLGDEVMDSGDTLTLTNISCDDWDVLVVDEDGDECILEEVDLCGDSAKWTISNNELLDCIDDTDQ